MPGKRLPGASSICATHDSSCLPSLPPPPPGSLLGLQVLRQTMFSLYELPQAHIAPMVVLNSNTDAVLIGLGVGGVMQSPGVRAPMSPRWMWRASSPTWGSRALPPSGAWPYKPAPTSTPWICGCNLDRRRQLADRLGPRQLTWLGGRSQAVPVRPHQQGA